MDTQSGLLEPFKVWQVRRQNIDQRFVQAMNAIEEKLGQLRDELREKIRDTEHTSELRKVQLQDITKYVEVLMTGLQGAVRSSRQ